VYAILADTAEKRVDGGSRRLPEAGIPSLINVGAIESQHVVLSYLFIDTDANFASQVEIHSKAFLYRAAPEKCHPYFRKHYWPIEYFPLIFSAKISPATMVLG